MIDFVKCLAESADIHAGNDFIMRIALGLEDLDAIKYLVEKRNFDFSKLDNDDSSYPWMMYIASHASVETIEYVIQHGVNPTADANIGLRLAARHGRLDVIKCLVQHGANIRSMNNQALRLAAKYGHDDVVRYMLSCGEFDGIREVIRCAASNDQLLVLKTLLTHFEISYSDLLNLYDEAYDNLNLTIVDYVNDLLNDYEKTHRVRK